jgi:hypothetical protein
VHNYNQIGIQGGCGGRGNRSVLLRLTTFQKNAAEKRLPADTAGIGGEPQLQNKRGNFISAIQII